MDLIDVDKSIYVFLLLAVGGCDTAAREADGRSAMVKLWQVGILPRLTVRTAPESQVPLTALETANNYMKFLF